MICNVYDDYKRKVLNSLSDNKIISSSYEKFDIIKDEYNYPEIKTLAVRENVLPYSHDDYRHNLCDIEHPKFRIGSVLLLKDDGGELYGQELFKYLSEKNLICGRIEDLSSDSASLRYDKKGETSVVSPGMIVYCNCDMLYKGINVDYSANCGTFFIDEVDDDGIIVLPPYCDGICLLDSKLLNKIVKIICLSKKEIFPHLYAVNHNYIVNELDLTTYIPLDCSNIIYEIYATDSISLDYYSYYNTDAYIVNGDYAFNFKSIVINQKNNKEVLHTAIRSAYSNVVYNINGSYLEAVEISGSDVKDLEINNNTINKNLLLKYADSYSQNSVENLSISNIHRFLLESDRNIIRLLNSFLNNIPDNSEVILSIRSTQSFYTKGKKSENNFDLFQDILEECNNRNIELKVISSSSSSYSYGVDVSSLDSHDIYDIDYFVENSLMNDLGDMYTQSYLNSDYFDSFKHKDKILDFIERLFGKCESTYGLLGYREACEKFCQPDINMIFKKLDILSGGVICECGAGIQVTLNFMQLYFLRMSGLESYQYIKLSDKNKYSGLYSSIFQNSRNRIRGDECIVFNSKLNNTYSTDELYDLAVVSFHQSVYSYYSYYSGDKSISHYNISSKKHPHDQTQYRIMVSLLYSESGPYKSNYSSTLRTYNNRIQVRDDLFINYAISDTSWKNINECLKLSKSSLLSYMKTLDILSYATNSKSKNLYGGRQVECLKASRSTHSQLPKDLIMDVVKSCSDYTIFNIKCLDTGDIFNIEGKTLYYLLSKGDLVSENLNHTLIKDEVLWLRNDYDKEVTANIEHMLGTKTLFTYSENGEDESLADYGLNFSSSGLANTFYMNFYNIGTELMLPSYITSAYEAYNNNDKKKLIDKYGEESWTEVEKVGIEVGNEEEVDVTYKITSLLKDPYISDSNYYDEKMSLTNISIARKNNVEFYCGENAVYKGTKPLVLESVICNKLLELPRKMSIDFCYMYRTRGIKDIYNHDVKIVVRDGSTIYQITCATDLDIAKDCLIHTRAFYASRLKRCVIHGGTIPRECFLNCNDFEELVVDGGHVVIDISAFKGCLNFKGINVINGGTYSLLNAENSVDIDNINNETDLQIPFYKELVDAYNESLNVDLSNSQVENVVPFSINSDRTITLKYADKKGESVLSIERLYNLYKKGLLNFKHIVKGRELDYIETLEHSKMDCLVFSPKTYNPLCNYKVLLVLDMKRIKDIKTLSDVNIVFAYQKEDWLNGKITDVPLKYLSPEYKSAVFFDDENYDNLDSDVKNAIVYHFWQNLSYYQYYFWSDFNDYYRGGRSNKYLRPEDCGSFYNVYHYNHIAKFDTLYLPASHEFSWYYKKMDASGEKKDKVIVGDLSRYGRMMHNKSYILPKADKVCLIPGIGENNLMYLKKIMCNKCHYYNNLLWSNCNILDIHTPTIIEPNALVYYVDYDGYICSYYEKVLSLLDIYANTEMSLFSVLFKECIVHNSDLVINCNIGTTAKTIAKYIDENSFIKFDGECKFQVNGLTIEQLRFLIENECYNYAYQLLVNSDTFNDLIEFNDIDKFYNDCKSGTIKVKRLVKKPVRYDGEIKVSVEPYKVGKVKNEISDLFSDDIEEDEPVLSDDEIVENGLSMGEIPDMLTLDYKYMEDKVEELDPEIYKEMLGENDSDIDFLNLNVKNSADVLVEMCGIDVEVLGEKGDKERELENLTVDEENLAKEFIVEKESAEAINQDEKVKEKIKSENDLMDKVRFGVTYLDEYRKLRNKRIEARRLYDEEKLKSEKVSEIKNIESYHVDESNDIFNEKNSDFVPTPKDNTHYVMETETEVKKPTGLAGSLLLDIINSYKQEVSLIELEILSPIYKNNFLVGYEVLNKKSGITKRLSIENVKKLNTNGKYTVLNAKDYDL